MNLRHLKVVNTEKFLNIYFGNQSLIIEILFGVVFVGVSFLAFRYFLGKETSPTSDLTGIEESLKKLIESNIKAKPEVTTPVGENSETEQGPDSSEGVANLKTQIEEKQARIAELEAQIASAPQGGGGGDSSALEEKIRDLESKLNEYSIIEDDIADLSFFKEETVRLQAEIDRLKGEIERSASAAQAPPPSPTPTPAPAATTSEPTPTPVVSAPEPSPAAAVPEEGTSADFVGSDIMAEFQAAVEAQKASSVTSKAAKKIEAIQAQKTASTEVAPTETSSAGNLSPQDEIDRLLAASQAEAEPETQASITPPNATITPETKSEIDGPIDLDKMVSEAANLDPSVAVDITSIDGELNTDKLLSEASEMEKDSQVISEFNDFLEKESQSENKG